MAYNYKRDLATFFEILSKPAGDRIKGKTINQVGKPIVHYDEDECSSATYFVDMEGGQHRESEFNDEQMHVLQGLFDKANRYPFICYPDIPADIMQILVYYADTHKDALNRLPLWKLARSGIDDSKIMWVFCYILDCGITVPDHIDLKKEDTSRWIDMYNQYFKGTKIETEFRTENLSTAAAHAVRMEAKRIAELHL